MARLEVLFQVTWILRLANNIRFETLQKAQRDALFDAWDHANDNILCEVASKLECIVKSLLAGVSSIATYRLESTDVPKEMDMQSVVQLLEVV